MIPPLIKDAVMYANLLVLLSTGFTLTYLTAKIPNFAHATFAGIGIYVTFTVLKIWKLNPYIAAPLAFMMGAGLGAFLYVVVIGTLKKYGATLVSLTISTLAIEIIVLAIINIYADYVRNTMGLISRMFMFRYADFEFMDLPGVLIVSTALAGLLILGFHLILTKTKFGISMRATIEDTALASVLGVNVELVSTISWFLTGGLAGLAGSLLPLWLQGSPLTGERILISVMASSILGGISSIYGAILGGYLIGLTEVLATVALMDTLGAWVSAYRLLIPLTVMAMVLLKAPRGFVGIIEGIQARGLSLRSIVRLKR